MSAAVFTLILLIIKVHNFLLRSADRPGREQQVHHHRQHHSLENDVTDSYTCRQADIHAAIMIFLKNNVRPKAWSLIMFYHDALVVKA